MNLPNCDNFCTADKCLELEQKIAELQFQLEGLTSLVNNHINQDIPQAHDYTPLVLVESFIEQNNILTTSITIDDINDFDKVNLPINQESNLSLSGSFESEILTLTVADGESQDSTEINIPLPEIPEYKESNLSLSGSFESEILTLTVADGESQSSTQITIPLPEIDEPEQCDLSINGSYLNELITITYSYCNGTNSFQIPIPLGDIINNYGGGGENLDCPNIETKIEDCCEQLLSAINSLQINLTNEINNTETIIINDVSEVKDAVCIDITGTVNSDYSCQFPEDEDGNIIPYYALSNSKVKSYNSQGFAGIHELLKLLSINLDIIHNDVCKAVDPLQTITLEDMYNFCDNSGIKREDFSDDEDGEKAYNQALNAYFLTLQKESKYGHLIPDSQDVNKPAGTINLIEAPTNWTNYIISDFALIQSRINRNIACNIDIPEMPDVVTLVASEKELHRVNGKQLIIQFVTLDNYPKRSSNSSYRPIQIPAPKESYDWVADFQDLRWQQGNQYAELVVEGWKHGVSGWFASTAAADAFFDTVLNLTTAVEINRLYPVHKTPKTNIPVRETRPWRAFISEVDDQGNARTLTKYFPLAND